MTSQPLISIIIPAYNAERWLRQCLDSMLAQTYTKLEILCVNDGSTDGSLAILREYEAKDGRVRAIDIAHAGLGAARNAALDVAQGEWITGVDADDWLVPDACERMMSRELEGVDVVAYEAETVFIDEPLGGSWYSYDLPYEGVRPMTNADIYRIRSPFCLKLYRRSVVEQFGLRFPVGHLYEDEAFHLLFLAHVRTICYVRERLYCRSIHKGSIMQQPDREPFEKANLAYMKDIFAHFVSHDMLETRWPCLWHYLVRKCLYFAEKNREGEALQEWKSQVMELAQRSGVLRNRSFAMALDGFFSTPRQGWLGRLFVKRKPGKVTYRLFGIPLLKVRKNDSETVWRVLGVVVRRVPDPL